MATITVRFGEGGANLNPNNNGSPTLAGALRDVATDVAVLRAALIVALAQLDADGGVTDTDYEANATPAAMLTIAG